MFMEWLTLQETRRIHDFMNIPKIEIIASKTYYSMTTCIIYTEGL